MADENSNLIPPGEPPIPEDVVPASSIEADPQVVIGPELRFDPLTGEPLIELPHAPSEVESQSIARPALTTPPRPQTHELLSLVVAAAGWFIPGAGYLLQRRWARALVGFAAVAALAIIGLKMRGNIFPPHGTEPFDFLGFIADAGSGIFYFLAKNVEAAGPDVSRAAGDYGTRLFATAGILNLLLILDAVEIARGEKS